MDPKQLEDYTSFEVERIRAAYERTRSYLSSHPSATPDQLRKKLGVKEGDLLVFDVDGLKRRVK